MDKELVVVHTDRGFAHYTFEDRYQNLCRISKSSIATEDCIWLGIIDAKPIVMASDAHKVGVVTKETKGWVPYPIPEEVLLHTEMHLTRDQVRMLLPKLIEFVETGEI